MIKIIKSEIIKKCIYASKLIGCPIDCFDLDEVVASISAIDFNSSCFKNKDMKLGNNNLLHNPNSKKYNQIFQDQNNKAKNRQIISAIFNSTLMKGGNK